MMTDEEDLEHQRQIHNAVKNISEEDREKYLMLLEPDPLQLTNSGYSVTV